MIKIYLLSLICCMSSVTMAQMQVGPKIGINLATISDGVALDSDEVRQPLSTGLNIGMAFSIQLNEQLFFTPELIFTQKGNAFKYTDHTNEISVKQKLQLHYIELPLLARFTYGDINKGYLSIGPTVGCWLGGRNKLIAKADNYKLVQTGKIVFITGYYGTPDENNVIMKIPEKESNYLELGFALAVGRTFNTPTGNIVADFRITPGLTNVVSHEFSGTKLYKNLVFTPSILYLLDFP